MSFFWLYFRCILSNFCKYVGFGLEFFSSVVSVIPTVFFRSFGKVCLLYVTIINLIYFVCSYFYFRLVKILAANFVNYCFSCLSLDYRARSFRTVFFLHLLIFHGIYLIMSSLFNVDYLRKSDLVFELRIRGRNADDTVDSLRKALRLLIAENVVPDSSNLSVDHIPQEIEHCRNILSVLYDDFENLGETSSKADVARFRDRLSCFSNRVLIINEFCEENSAIEPIDDLAFFTAEAKRMSISLSGSHPFSTPKQNNTSGLAEPENKGGNFVVSGNISSNRSTLGVSTLQGASLPQSSVPNLVTGLSSALQNVDISVPTGTRAVASGSSTACSSSVKPVSSYSKLKHPCELLLNKIPQRVSGFDTDALLKFFRISLKIISAFPEIRPQVLSLLIPYSAGAFRDLILQYIDTNDFHAFHQAAIKTFIPVRQLNSITNNLFLRKQGDNERLPEYIAEVKENACILQLRVSEREVVDTILEGINFRTRSCATFCQRPTNYVELDALCIQIMNIDFVHQGNLSQPVLSRGYPSFPTPRHRTPGNNPVICYFCRKPGHTKPHCPDLRNRSKNL